MENEPKTRITLTTGGWVGAKQRTLEKINKRAGRQGESTARGQAMATVDGRESSYLGSC